MNQTRSSARQWIHTLGALALCAGMGAGCKRERAQPRAVVERSEGAPDARASKACEGGVVRGALTWFEDAYEQARACAQSRGVPLVIDQWAPWCHTCLSMSQYVLTDPGFAPFAQRFVFVATDTDRVENAPVVARFPLRFWPTYLVVSPDDQSVQARLVGAASAEQFRAFLEQAEHSSDHAAESVRAGDRAVVAGELATAETAYSNALEAAPAAWSSRPRVLVALMDIKRRRGDAAGCVALGLRAMDETGDGASATDFLVTALACARELERADLASVTALRTAAVARWNALLDRAQTALSVDDRSDAMVNVREVLESLGRSDEARAMAERQRVMLDEAASKAPTPQAAMTYNWHRAEVYAYLNRPMEIVPALEASARALPDAYDPPYRLAWVLLRARSFDRARAWAERARSLAYGPRKAKVIGLMADIDHARGDFAAERTAREDALALLSSLPAGQVTPEALAHAREAPAAMDARD